LFNGQLTFKSTILFYPRDINFRKFLFLFFLYCTFFLATQKVEMQNKTLQNATLFIIFYGDASLHNYFYDNWLCSIKIQSQVPYSKLRRKINFKHQRSNSQSTFRLLSNACDYYGRMGSFWHECSKHFNNISCSYNCEELSKQ